MQDTVPLRISANCRRCVHCIRRIKRFPSRVEVFVVTFNSGSIDHVQETLRRPTNWTADLCAVLRVDDFH